MDFSIPLSTIQISFRQLVFRCVMSSPDAALDVKEELALGTSEWGTEECQEEAGNSVPGRMGKRRTRGQEPRKDCWESGRTNAWLKRRKKRNSCSQEARMTSQKCGAEKGCSCSQVAGMRRNFLLH